MTSLKITSKHVPKFVLRHGASVNHTT